MSYSRGQRTGGTIFCIGVNYGGRDAECRDGSAARGPPMTPLHGSWAFAEAARAAGEAVSAAANGAAGTVHLYAPIPISAAAALS